MKKLDNPRKIFNIDNTENKSGSITHYLNLDVFVAQHMAQHAGMVCSPLVEGIERGRVIKLRASLELRADWTMRNARVYCTGERGRLHLSLYRETWSL